MLAEYFVAKHCKTYAQPARKMVPETITRLQSYPWPGNVRELENALIYAVLLTDGDAILPVHQPEEILAFQKSHVQHRKENHVPEYQQAECVLLAQVLKLWKKPSFVPLWHGRTEIGRKQQKYWGLASDAPESVKGI